MKRQVILDTKKSPSAQTLGDDIYYSLLNFHFLFKALLVSKISHYLDYEANNSIYNAYTNSSYNQIIMSLQSLLKSIYPLTSLKLHPYLVYFPYHLT